MKINRLFEIIYLLLNRKTITAKELAKHFEVSPRTIYRDVELLSSAGIPIYMTKGKGGGISLFPDFILNKTVLTENEKIDILSALYAIEAITLEKKNTTVQKISSLFGSSNSDWIEVDFSRWTNINEEYEVFALLKTAILRKKIVQFIYHGSKNSIKRIVEPIKLCFKGQSWYLYAYCRLRNDYRFFKLCRMKNLTVLCKHFDRQKPKRIFDGNKTFQDNIITLTLQISKEMAYRVYDEFSEYELLPDGNFKVTLSMPQSEWMYYYIFTFGEYCEVLEPEYIRLQIKEKLQKILGIYT
ncbi:helix-turn-helix transcriptional regulator [Defluviitalea phaphyphila]|uniref:helix-turn-helix transcriptional regulator n=1 Tax=Defluviitalea phaphyphila TaxID=1473580 RepID=UPI000731701E|nr:YafY family protein [Defluviitalea phaphyphila]